MKKREYVVLSGDELLSQLVQLRMMGHQPRQRDDREHGRRWACYRCIYYLDLDPATVPRPSHDSPFAANKLSGCRPMPDDDPGAHNWVEETP